jgi:hypothetical protein
VTASPGAAAFYNVRGIDVGVLSGVEWALGGGAARRWDFNGRPWFGLAIAYHAPK